MSSDRPQSMDERLKAHAARRRAEAGESRGLHPASRRILQEEVRRNYGAAPRPATERGPRAENWFAWLWTRSALAGAVCVVLFVAAFAVWPWLIGTRSTQGLSPSVKHNAESAPGPLAKGPELSPPSPAEGAAPAPAAASPVPARRDTARIEESVARELALPGPPTTSGRGAVTQLAPSTPPATETKLTVALPDAAKGVATSFAQTDAPAPGLPAPVTYNFEAPVTASAPSAPASVDLATTRASPPGSAVAPRPQTAATGLAESNQSQAGARMSQFTRVDRYRRNLNSPPRSGVLNQFQFERTGRAVRITDADGSVYSGETVAAGDLRLEAAANGSVAPAAAAAKAAEAEVVSSRTSTLPSTAGATPVYFRVSGTNRTLRQSVEFSGAYAGQGIPPTGAPQVGGQSLRFGGASSAQRPVDDAALVRQPTAADRIVGRAVVGGTNRVEVEAVAE